MNNKSMSISISKKGLFLVLFIFALLPSGLFLCTDPQKAFFLSYDALGKRDSLQDVFK